MISTHVLGYPRIGHQRALKTALEQYWSGQINSAQLQHQASEIQQQNWQQQHQAGLSVLTAGDFSLYDHVLSLTMMLGAIPERFSVVGEPTLDDEFRMARGRSVEGTNGVQALAMSKWFDTNYHYLVPELHAASHFQLTDHRWFQQLKQAKQLGQPVKAVLPGPVTYLWLASTKEKNFDRLTLLHDLVTAYGQILTELDEIGIEWLQLDEPILSLDLTQPWKQALEYSYNRLQRHQVNVLVANYFGSLGNNLNLAATLPVAGLHIDAVRAPQDLKLVLDQMPHYKVLSVGVVDGRNIWKTDLQQWRQVLQPAYQKLGERLWLASSCSLLHTPLDLEQETKLPKEIKNGFSFAKQKLSEIQLLADSLTQPNDKTIQQTLTQHQTDRLSYFESHQRFDREIQNRQQQLAGQTNRREMPVEQRRQLQDKRFQLPLLPTTTIGSFPQTDEIRQARVKTRRGDWSVEQYQQFIQSRVKDIIQRQESMGLDVLVHGEPERNDMVEFFADYLTGMTVTEQGWVQSYGSRCVKPPIISSDIVRSQPMTVKLSQYAQGLTNKPVKGMLTGPVTILKWSFPRDDIALQQQCEQLALAIQDEVRDLEAAGIGMIQVDEPALREGLPLNRSEWANYLTWAVRCFRLATLANDPATQIHSHLCYSQFADILSAIDDMDVDVLSIECARSQMTLLQQFDQKPYKKQLGPGIYDIHSPVVPKQAQLEELIHLALQRVSPERLWINPDCGLKTRTWQQVEIALTAMVSAAKRIRDGLGKAVNGDVLTES